MKSPIILKVQLAPNRFAKFPAPQTFSQLIELVHKLPIPSRQVRVWYVDGENEMILLTPDIYQLLVSTWPWLEMRLEIEFSSLHLRETLSEVTDFIRIQGKQWTNQAEILWGKARLKGEEWARRVRQRSSELFRIIQARIQSLKLSISQHYQASISSLSLWSSSIQAYLASLRISVSHELSTKLPIWQSKTVHFCKEQYQVAKAAVVSNKRRAVSIGIGVAASLLFLLTAQAMTRTAGDLEMRLLEIALETVSVETLALCRLIPQFSAVQNQSYQDSKYGQMVFFGFDMTGFLLDPDLDRVSIGSFDDEFRLNGEGAVVSKGNILLGSFVNGEFVGGKVVIVEGRSVYEGESMGKMKGFGVEARYKEGGWETLERVRLPLEWEEDVMSSFYTGSWSNGTYDGPGELRTHGFTYSGNFLQGVQTGTGRLITASGEVRQGDFVAGKLHGFGCVMENRGNSLCGDFENGECHGKAVRRGAKGTSHVSCTHGRQSEPWW